MRKLLQDLLKEVQLSDVMKERVNLAEEKREKAERENTELLAKVAELEQENAELRKQIPAAPAGEFAEGTIEAMLYLFHDGSGSIDLHEMAERLKMDNSEVVYHLERLQERGLALYTGAFDQFTYWDLTDNGRRYVIENGLNKR